MPPRRIKKDDHNEDLAKKIHQEVLAPIKRMKEALELEKIRQGEKVLEEILGHVPKEILSMNFMDFLSKPELHDFLNCTESMHKIVEEAPEVIGNVKEDLNSGHEENALITNTPDKDITNTERLQLRTPHGVNLSVPSLIRTKVTSEMEEAYRKPHADEEIAFSVYGSPMILPTANPEVRTLMEVLNANDVQSPETRKLTESISSLLYRKMAKSGNLKAKDEPPGTAV